MKTYKELTEEIISEGHKRYPGDDMTMKELKIAVNAAKNILDMLEDGASLQRWQISAIVVASDELASVCTSMRVDHEEEMEYDEYGYPSMYGEEFELDEAMDYNKMTTAELKAAAFAAIKSGDRNAVKEITAETNKRIANKGGTPITKLTTDPKKLDALKKQLSTIKREAVELDEKLKASDDMGTWVKDFQDSDAPQFKGKSQKERQKMAIAAKLAAERNEEVELDEVSASTLRSYVDKARADKSRQQKARTVAKNDHKKYGIPSDKERADAAHRKASQRNTGISMAKRKLGGYTKGTQPKVLAREEVELDEVSDKMLDRYRQKAFADQPAGNDGSDKYRKRKFGRDLAFAKQTGRAKVLATKEEVEQIDELSKKTLGSYIKKAASDIGYAAAADDSNKELKRHKGIAKAANKLTKEEVELDEAETVNEISNKNKKQWLKKARKSQVKYYDAAHAGRYFAAKGDEDKDYWDDYATSMDKKYRQRNALIKKHWDNIKEEVELDEAVGLKFTNKKDWEEHAKKTGHKIYTPSVTLSGNVNTDKVHLAKDKNGNIKANSQMELELLMKKQIIK